MAVINGYTNLPAIKTMLGVTDTDDDDKLNIIINQASRFIDGPDGAGRVFYPRMETRLYNTPSYRTLLVDDDLLEVITITNGDSVELPSTEYLLDPPNVYPKYGIRIKQSSTYYWTVDSDGDSEQVISVLGWWGFRQRYSQRAWKSATTLNEGGVLNASDLTFTVASGPTIQEGNIIKIESEIMNVTGVSINDITVYKRGDNGSTATTHADTTAIYVWMPEEDIETSAQSVTKSLFRNRFGQDQDGIATITGAGVVITPRDIPKMVLETIKGYRRLT